MSAKVDEDWENNKRRLMSTVISQITNRLQKMDQNKEKEKDFLEQNSTKHGAGSSQLSTEKDSKSTERLQILREIVTTEKIYVRDLKTVIKVYSDPLKSIISQSEHDAIFTNLSSICALHEQLLGKLLANIPTEINEKTLLGDVFHSMASFMKIYAPYCKSYMLSVEQVQILEKDSSKFASFLKEAQKNTECGGLQLQDYLIKPVQRLCKYPLLFKNLLKATPSTHKDYPHVERTCGLIGSVTESVNEYAAEVINFERLSEFNRTVQGYQADVAQHWFIREELLREKKSDKERHIYLLSHALIITHPSKKKKEKFIQKIETGSFSVTHVDLEWTIQIDKDHEDEDEKEKEKDKDNEDTSDVTLTFLCPSDSSRAGWVSDLSNLQENPARAPRNTYIVVDDASNTDDMKKDKGKGKSKTLRRRISLKGYRKDKDRDTDDDDEDNSSTNVATSGAPPSPSATSSSGTTSPATSSPSRRMSSRKKKPSVSIKSSDPTPPSPTSASDSISISTPFNTQHEAVTVTTTGIQLHKKPQTQSQSQGQLSLPSLPKNSPQPSVLSPTSQSLQQAQSQTQATPKLSTPPAHLPPVPPQNERKKSPSLGESESGSKRKSEDGSSSEKTPQNPEGSNSLQEPQVQSQHPTTAFALNEREILEKLVTFLDEHANNGTCFTKPKENRTGKDTLEQPHEQEQQKIQQQYQQLLGQAKALIQKQ